MKVNNEIYCDFLNLESNLDQDGLLTNLYHLIWKHGKDVYKFHIINLPQTVIYKYRKPVNWFFMKNKLLLKKTKQNLQEELIKKYFLNLKKKSKIIAVYISYNYKDKINFEKYNKNFIVEYLEKADLIKFFDETNIKNDGILQEFIEPYSNNNSILKVNWSKYLTEFYEIRNNFNIYNLKNNKYKRIPTFESNTKFSTLMTCKSYKIKEILNKNIKIIINHWEKITKTCSKIVNLNGYFKINNKNELYLLFFTSIKTELTSIKIKSTKNKIRLIDFETKFFIKQEYSNILQITENKNDNKNKIITCSNCLQKYNRKFFYEIDFRKIFNSEKKLVRLYKLNYQIEDYYQKKIDNYYNQNKNVDKDDNKYFTFIYNINNEDLENKHRNEKLKKIFMIPKAILNISDNLSLSQYQSYIKNDYFLNNRTIVCENCYIDIANNLNNINVKKNNSLELVENKFEKIINKPFKNIFKKINDFDMENINILNKNNSKFVNKIKKKMFSIDKKKSLNISKHNSNYSTNYNNMSIMKKNNFKIKKRLNFLIN